MEYLAEAVSGNGLFDRGSVRQYYILQMQCQVMEYLTEAMAGDGIFDRGSVRQGKIL